MSTPDTQPSGLPSTGLSRRTLVAGAAWGVPALALTSPTAAFANTSGQSQVRLALGGGRIPAVGAVSVTATVVSAENQPLAGQAVSFTGPAGAVFGDTVGITAGDGTFTTTFDLNRPGAKPGSTIAVTAISGDASASASAIVLSSNALSNGRNANGEVGIGVGGVSDPSKDPILQMTQLQRVFPSPIVDVQGGATGFTLALLADGTVWAVGGDFHGCMGGVVPVGSYTQTWKQISGLTDVAQIAAASANGYALTHGGALWAWGVNDRGQLGNGTTVDSPAPVEVIASGVRQVAVGDSTAYVAMSDGSVRAWGQAARGAVGNGTTSSNQLAPVEILPASAGVSQVAAQYNGGYALANGRVYAWGRNEFGELADGTTVDTSRPAVIANLSGVAEVAGGGDGAYVLKTDNTVWAWGRNDQGQCGDGTTTHRLTPVQVTGLSGVTQLAAIGRSGAVLTSAGEVWAWGENAYGKLGDGTTTDSSIPVKMIGLSSVAVSALTPRFGGGGTSRFALITADSTVALTMDSSVVAGAPATVTATVRGGARPLPGVTVTLTGTGAVTFGQASGTTDANGTFQTTVQVGRWSRPGRVLQVTAATDAASATASATVLGANAMSTGRNANGEGGIGVGGVSDASKDPVLQMTQFQRAFPSPVVDIRGAATGMTLVLLQDKTVWVVGGDFHGDTAGGAPVGSYTETWKRITSLSDVEQIAVGSGNGYAITAGGAVWAWGINDRGQLGDGTTNDSATPVRVISSGVKQVASGDSTVYALMEDGSVRAWGQASHGAIGNGATSNQLTPVEILPASTGVSQVAAQYNGGYALVGDRVLSWGRGESGQLGNGSLTDNPTPTVIPNLSGVVEIAAPGDNAYVLKTDKTVWAWGRNHVGQIGIGNTVNPQPLPVKVAGLPQVVQLAAAGGGAAVLTTEGNVWTWGGNEWGWLGDGTRTTRTAPVQMIGLDSVTVSRLAPRYGGGGTTRYGLVTADNSVSVGIGGAAPQGATTSTLAAGAPTVVVARVAAGSLGVSGVDVAFTGTAGATFTQNQSTTDPGGVATTTVQVDAATKPGRILQVTATTDQTAATATAIILGANAMSCGRNAHGEVGIGAGGVSTPSVDTVLTMTRLQRAFPSPVVDVQGYATGGTIALLEDGTVWAVGGDFHGTLGGVVPMNSYTEKWKRIPSLTGIAQIAVGSATGFALTSQGAVWAWGFNQNGRVGNGSTVDVTTPVRVITSGAKQVASGDGTAYVAMTDGSVQAWGQGARGAVGDGGTTDVLAPVQVLPASAGVTQVAGQYNGGYALANGNLYSWGRNEFGQLANGTTTDTSTPAIVPNFSDVAQVTASGDGAYVLKNDKTVWGWGRNNGNGEGMVGDGTNVHRSRPVQVTGISNVVQLAGAGGSGAVLTAAGEVWGWGANGDGRLGDGTTTDRLSPVRMTGLSGVTISRVSAQYGGGGVRRFALILK